MIPPMWLNAVVRDFGRAAGIDGFALNERGAATMRFENGGKLHLEFTGEELVVAVTMQSGDLKRLLSFSHYRAKLGFTIRTGVMPKTDRLVMAIRMKDRDATLPHLNAAFGVLWRIAAEIGGTSWA